MEVLKLATPWERGGGGGGGGGGGRLLQRYTTVTYTSVAHGYEEACQSSAGVSLTQRVRVSTSRASPAKQGLRKETLT